MVSEACHVQDMADLGVSARREAAWREAEMAHFRCLRDAVWQRTCASLRWFWTEDSLRGAAA